MKPSAVPTSTLLKYLNQTKAIALSTFIILCCLFLGKAVQQSLSVAVPGSVWGLLILLTLLTTRILPLNWVLPAGQWLLGYMTLFFVPVGVGLLAHQQVLSQYWMVIVVSCLVSTLLVLLITAVCFRWLTK